MTISTMRSWIEGLKWANTSEFLQKLAYTYNLDIEIRKETGWIRETIFFKVSGEDTKLEEFKSVLKKTIENYNKEIE